MKQVKRSPATLARMLVVSIVFMIVTGCASSGVTTVPMKIQSDPLGAYVMFQVQGGDQSASYDWIFLGNTPVDVRKSIDESDWDHADAFVLRVMKEGYLEQQKSFTARDFYREVQEKDTVFWNPKLIPAGS
ncbi:MAG: hypothetical protein AAF402_01920 [Pseudomonadota bacterium]